MSELTYRLAIRDALAEEMGRDERVVLIGEDVRIGGVFNATPDLYESFGPDRVIDTPISELAFTGAAFGAAVMGLRPVVEIMFADFLALALDSLANQAAKYWFVSNEQASVPLVVRTTVGAGGRFGAMHSQTPTGWLMGLSGVKVVAPSTPGDVKSLLAFAIRDENPVVVFEHRMLYGRRDALGAEPAPGGATQVAARVRRAGSDVTVVGALAALDWALAAADELASDGIEAEVIDLRSLRPLDIQTIAESVARTRHLVVVEEGPPVGGYAGEVISGVVEAVGPVAARRVTMPDLPVPFSPPLENAVLPDTPKVLATVRGLLDASSHPSTRGEDK